ncbi:3013_t:CDS:2 [Ambispora gerdemannii]|uniref:3013_t:CDS:1 n=1 Tax=Ambispora gerdemannii TaxID=144530 RepID=A0A9N8ZBI2_9GLOM|nr:3013_t:CDS:2 [Ambispora gerdemannii]
MVEQQRTSNYFSPIRPRRKWTPNETADLIDGCYTHGVGDWNAIFLDPKYKFQDRRPVDLRDKQEYARLYNTQPRSQSRYANPPPFELCAPNRRKQYFTSEEDTKLLRGIETYGRGWSLMIKDESIGLAHRSAIDLKDRCRTAFPEKYKDFGFKERDKSIHSQNFGSSSSLRTSSSLKTSSSRRTSSIRRNVPQRL